jgi:alpha-beta hydrolase superfamily lysophospholipase
MKAAHYSHQAADRKSIYVRHWIPSGTVKALILVVHGKAEHSARYERFAEILAAAGYEVWAPDHRGHGKTAATEAELGFFADKDGFRLVIEDLHEIRLEAEASHPELPFFFFGHSLGSFLGQGYIALHGEGLAGAVLCGTAGPMPGGLILAGKIVAALGSTFKGRHAKAPLAEKMSFGSYNDAFKPNRTAFDWLSRDNAEVDKYVADPLCGFDCSYGFFSDLLSGLAFIQDPATKARIPADLPVLMIAGAKDPVGGATGSVDILAASYRGRGIKDVEMKLYPGARHEILNETNRDEVMGDVLAWLEKRRSKAK